MQFYQHVGIALATAFSSWLNFILLLLALIKSNEIYFDKEFKEKFKKILFINIIFLFFILYFKNYISIFSNFNFLNISIFTILSIIFYMGLATLFRIYIFSNFQLLILK